MFAACDKFRCVGWGFLLLLAGCDGGSRSEQPIPTAKATALDSAAPASAPKRQEPATRTIGGIRFEIPADWEEKPLASTVLLAEYSLPGEAGPGRLTLSTAAGGTTANLDRWKGQFQRGPSDPEPKESPVTAAGKNATMIEVSGTFTDMFGGGGPRSSWQLQGVVIPIDSDHNYFVKLTGPQATVAAHRAQIEQFVQTARFQE